MWWRRRKPRPSALVRLEEPLTEEGRRQVAEQVRQMVTEYRLKPSQEKEDLLGVEVAALPPEAREYVTEVLLGIVAEERGAGRG